MLFNLDGKHVDDHLADLFFRSPSQHIVILRERGKPLDSETTKVLKGIFVGVEEREENAVDVFERSDSSKTSRCDMSISVVILPALLLIFKDPDSDILHIGTIEGEENVRVFVTKFAGRLENPAGVKKAEEEVEIMYNE